jgi:hypothetical protein
MIIGALMVGFGLVLGLNGSFNFNFGQMITGHLIAGAGVVVFLDHFLGWGWGLL